MKNHTYDLIDQFEGTEGEVIHLRDGELPANSCCIVLIYNDKTQTVKVLSDLSDKQAEIATETWRQ